MNTRKLGSQGLVVSELGLGCMRMFDFYGGQDDREANTTWSEATATIHRALELGITLLN